MESNWTRLTRELLAECGTPATPRTLASRLRKAIKARGLACSPFGSGNTKTEAFGTYRRVGLSCPECPQASVCYAMRGHVAMAQRRASESLSADLTGVIAAAIGAYASGSPLRLHVAGDFYINGSLDRAYLLGVRDVLRELPGLDVWTYTHAPTDAEYREIKETLEGLAVVRWSERDALVVQSWDEAPKGSIRCPQQKSGGKITCKACTLCWTRPERVIAFHIH